MEPISVFGFVVAWLGCWLVDLTQPRPITFPQAVKLVIVAVCLFFVLMQLLPPGQLRLR